MDETVVKRAIASATRETIALYRRTPIGKAQNVEALAREFAEQLILPAVSAMVEQALEAGFNQGRESVQVSAAVP